MDTNDPARWLRDYGYGDRLAHKKQRVDQSFSFYDWINFDKHLAWVIANGLRKFRIEGSGHPSQLTEEQWNSKLDIMIAGFEAHLKLDEFVPGDQEYPILVNKRDLALTLFVQFFDNLWD